MIQKVNIRDMKKWKDYRLPITTEGQKHRAALLRVLINDYIKGLGATHVHIIHKTQKENRKKKSRKRRTTRESYQKKKRERELSMSV